MIAPPASARRLHGLTALRFVAAAMIVVFHSRGKFGISDRPLGFFRLDFAVAFFFVLSGFILTYVYPTLETWPARGRFFLARFARLWPAHIAAIGLLYVVLGAQDKIGAGHGTLAETLANVLMIHAWIPAREFYFSYNVVSWSISTEFAFYFAFLLLIGNWQRTWWWKLPLALALAWGVVAWCGLHKIPMAQQEPYGISGTGMLYISPLARLFEFVLGMTAALAWRRLAPKLRYGPLVGTALEVAAIGLVVLNVWYLENIIAAIESALPAFGPASREYLGHGPIACLSFAVLVLVMACERGWLSRALSLPVCVVLGEISFTIYLTHYILLQYYDFHQIKFARVPGWLCYSFYWAILLLISHLIWSWLERPLRSRLVSLWPKRTPTPSAAEPPAGRASSAFDRLTRPTRWVFVGELAILACLLIPTLVLALGPTRLRFPVDDLAAWESRGEPIARGAVFDDQQILRAASFQPVDQGLQINLVWEARRAFAVRHRVAIHLMDAAGKVLAQCDYDADEFSPRAGELWREQTLIPKAKLANITTLGLALYTKERTLAVDRGPRDWDGHRLLLDVPGNH